MTAEQYEQYLFGENGYIKKFYSEMTHGQVELETDVRGWYHMYAPGSSFIRPGLSYCGPQNDALYYMADYYNVDVNDYDIVISISNCEEYNNLGGITFQTFGLPGIPTIFVLGHFDRLGVSEMENYIDWPGLAWNLVHEIGHALGLGTHSNTLDCNQEILGNNCQIVDYGNMFDAMGHWDGRIFNFLRQKEAGWIGNENIPQINESGSYYLDNLQKEGGVVGAIINVNGNPLYAVEHRAAEGFDSYIESETYNKARVGLLLYGYTGAQSWPLIDPHPTADSIFEDIKYDGIYSYQSFYDNNFGVSIDVTSVTDEGIYFDVNYFDPEYPIPFPPSNLTIQQIIETPGGHDFQICWQDNSNNETGFFIERTIAGHPTQSQTFDPDPDPACYTSVLSYTYSGATYYFKVRALGEIFNSHWSETLEFSY